MMVVCVCVGVSNNEYLSKRINTLWLFSTTATGEAEGLDVGGSRLVVCCVPRSVGFREKKLTVSCRSVVRGKVDVVRWCLEMSAKLKLELELEMD